MTDSLIRPSLRGGTEEALHFIPIESSNATCGSSLSVQPSKTTCINGTIVKEGVACRSVVEESWDEEFNDLFFSWRRLTNPQHRRLAITIIRTFAGSA